MPVVIELSALVPVLVLVWARAIPQKARTAVAPMAWASVLTGVFILNPVVWPS